MKWDMAGEGEWTVKDWSFTVGHPDITCKHQRSQGSSEKQHRLIECSLYEYLHYHGLTKPPNNTPGP